MAPVALGLSPQFVQVCTYIVVKVVFHYCCHSPETKHLAETGKLHGTTVLGTLVLT